MAEPQKFRLPAAARRTRGLRPTTWRRVRSGVGGCGIEVRVVGGGEGLEGAGVGGGSGEGGGWFRIRAN